MSVFIPLGFIFTLIIFLLCGPLIVIGVDYSDNRLLYSGVGITILSLICLTIIGGIVLLKC